MGAYGLPTKVKEIMTRGVVTIEEDKMAIDAARLMTEKGVGCLVVVREGKVVGIVTERDMVVRVISQGLDPRMIKVGQFMTKPVITCPSETSIVDLVKLMSRYRIRRVPVVDGENLMGIVTSYDAALYGWGMSSHS